MSSRPLSGVSRLPLLFTGVALVTAMLAGCDSGDDSSSASEPATTSATPLASAKCVTLEHKGQKLGVTVPADFSVATPPDIAADMADTYRVNILSLARRMETNRILPIAMLAVYGYDRSEREAQSALEASVLNFTSLTGGIHQARPISATPAPVAGTQGAAGGYGDSRALDYNAPDYVDTMLRWWTIPTGDGLFVVTFAAVTPELDAQYATEIPAGLTLGGC